MSEREREESPEIPDLCPTEAELKKPRFSVERVPDTMIQQTYEQWDPEQERMVVRARGTTKHFHVGHNFLIHIEGDAFQDPQDQANRVTWLLTQQAFVTLTKNGVNPDRFSPELGVIKVSVPRFCEKDEARKTVVLAVQAMIDVVCTDTPSK